MNKDIHMATAALNRALESLGDQEITLLKNDMIRVNKEMRGYNLRNMSQLVAFRFGRASKRTMRWAHENRVVNKNWTDIVERMSQILEKRQRELLRDKVIEYREKIMEKERNEKQFVRNCWKDKSVIWMERNVYCVICNVRGRHATRDCEFTFQKMKERMLKEKEDIENKQKETEQGKAVYFERRKNEKRMKVRGYSLEEIFGEFKDAFYNEGEKIRFCEVEKCSIKTKKGEKIVKKGQIIPQALRRKTDQYLQELEDRGIIRRSDSDWRNPIRSLEKPNGDIRLVSNFMAHNDLCEKDPYTLKNIREIIQSTSGYDYFTVLDLKEAFYAVEIEECDKKKTAFEFDGRVYEWNSMVMGFKNAPQIMQRIMTKVLNGILGNGIEVYMDDIIIAGKDRQEHDSKLKDVLSRLAKNNLRVNKKKIQFA